MNQAIQFPDREIFDEQKSCIVFPALVNGMLIDCYISFDKLRQMFGMGLSCEQLKAAFIDNRWDIEELAEKLIKERFDYDNNLIILD